MKKENKKFYVLENKESTIIKSIIINNKNIYSGESIENYKNNLILSPPEAMKLIDNNLKKKYKSYPLIKLKDKDQYMDKIEQLPPAKWYTHANINFYFCMEQQEGNFVVAWIIYNDNFYESIFDITATPEETAAEFLRKLNQNRPGRPGQGVKTS